MESRTVILIALLLAVFTTNTSCDKEENLPELSRLTFHLPALETVPDTRAVVWMAGDSVHNAWSETDTVGLFTDGEGPVAIPMGGHTGSQEGIFTGETWMKDIRSGYGAFCPLPDRHSAGPQEIRVDYTGQFQSHPDDAGHLVRYDFMAVPQFAVAQPDEDLHFKRLGCLMVLQVKMPTAGTLQQLTLEAVSPIFTIQGTVDLTASQPAITPTEKADSLSVLLDVTTAGGQPTTTVYWMMAPTDCTGQRVTASIKDDRGNVQAFLLPEQNYEAGKAYLLSTVFAAATRSHLLPGPEFNSRLDGLKDIQQISSIDFKYLCTDPEPTGSYSLVSTSDSPYPAYAVCQDGKVTVTTAAARYQLNPDSRGMFAMCSNVRYLDLRAFDTRLVTTMGDMFTLCTQLESVDLSSFNTQAVSSMESMFSFCFKLGQLDCSSFDTPQLTDMSYMFMGCKNLQELDLGHLNTSKVRRMPQLFDGCRSLTRLDLSGFNTEQVNNMFMMFNNCKQLTTLDLHSFNTVQVTDMGGIFSGCTALKELDISSFNTSKVTNMGGMFTCCEQLARLDLRHFDTSQAINMAAMFVSCKGLRYLDISTFNTGKSLTVQECLMGCNRLDTLNFGRHFHLTPQIQTSGMCSDMKANTILCTSALKKSITTDTKTGLATDAVGQWILLDKE